MWLLLLIEAGFVKMKQMLLTKVIINKKHALSARKDVFDKDICLR